MTKGKLIASLACALMLGSAGVATAAPIFSDNFNTENGGAYALNYNTFTNWNVINGTVDLIGQGSPYDFLPGNGLYVDLDGSSNAAGLMIPRLLNIPTAGNYTLSFQLAGSHRTPTNETVNVQASLGGYADIFSIASGQGFTTYTADLYFAQAGDLYLTFQNLGGDNMGALLDNISVAPAVPEPGTMMLLGAGFLGLAIYNKRRKNA